MTRTTIIVIAEFFSFLNFFDCIDEYSDQSTYIYSDDCTVLIFTGVIEKWSQTGMFQNSD